MGFQQGLSGLGVSSRHLDVVGNNIANAGTVGFKHSRAEFADIFAQSSSGIAANTPGIGSKQLANAQQFTQGNLSPTENPLDLGISGNGFFRMQDPTGGVTYTRNGQFQMDKNGYIVNSQGIQLTGFLPDSTGAINLSTPAPIQLPTGDIAPTVTSEVTAQLNLDARSTVPVPAFSIANPASYNASTSINVYDSLGYAHTATMYFRNTGANAWDVYTTVSNSNSSAVPLGPTAMTFNSNGTMATPAAPFAQSVTLTNGATTPFSFNIDVAGTTQFGSAFGVNSMSQDGYTSGRLVSMNFDDKGVLVGRYSNGQTQNLAQLAMVNFANIQGLQPAGDNLWAETFESGAPIVNKAGTSNLGTIQPASLEDANIDLTKELVDMITAQRNYQANAQTIKAEDTIMQTIVNIR